MYIKYLSSSGHLVCCWYHKQTHATAMHTTAAAAASASPSAHNECVGAEMFVFLESNHCNQSY